MAAEVSLAEPIPEYTKINQLWHIHIDSIWRGAPDLIYDANDYSIFLPDMRDTLDESIKDASVRFYFEHLKPMFDAFKETPPYKKQYISNFWSEQAPDAPPLELSVRGTRIIIDNKDDLDKLIESDENLIEPFDALLVELNKINHVMPTNISYDIVLYINTHGATMLGSEDPEATCVDDRTQFDITTGEVVKIPGRIKLHIPPPPNQVTFLTATQLGIDNIRGDDDVTKLQNHILKTLEETQTLDIHKLQSWLQHKKKMTTTKGFVDRVGKRLGIETVQQYARSVGWRIAHNYVNRRYAPDPAWNPKIIILYVKEGSPIPLKTSDLFEQILFSTGRSSMATKSWHLKPHIFRTELLTYLYERGYKHPLIIDASCGGFYTHKPPNDRDVRAMTHVARLGEGAAGGRKTRKYKKTSTGTKKKRKTKKYDLLVGTKERKRRLSKNSQ